MGPEALKNKIKRVLLKFGRAYKLTIGGKTDLKINCPPPYVSVHKAGRKKVKLGDIITCNSPSMLNNSKPD